MSGEKVPCGLINQGMTCYLNAVLQTLFMTTKFRDHVLRSSPEKNLLKALADLFRNLMHQHTAVSTEGVTKALNISNVYEQQDAAEYLQMILHRVPEPSEIFRGILETSTMCSVCQKKYPAENDFLSIPLSIDKGQRDVRHALREHLENHDMSGDDQLYCVKCDKMRDMKTRNEIKKWPDVLTLQLKRFEMAHTRTGFTYRKNESKIKIPSDIQYDPSSPVYDLYGIINHHGSYISGHYDAVIKDNKRGNWYHFNDVTVTTLRYSDHQWINDRSSSAYLLMYSKRSISGYGGRTGVGYCGLENQGSCYLNAVLQTLFMTKEFREHVNRLDRDGVSSDGNLAEELNKLFNKLETQEKNTVSAAEIMRSLGISDVHKRDAAELLRLILNKTPGSSELFKGTMKTTRTCRSCRDKPEQISEVLHSLTVSLQNSQDVEHVLQAYAGGNKSVDSVYCDRCKRKTDIDTKTEMIEFPKHMIVELKRSETSTYWPSFSKNEAIIRPHIKVSCHEYELYAVVNYSKTFTWTGCYNADIKCEDESWHRFEDHNVSQSPLKRVFINESSTLRSSDPCLLVYKHREQTAGDTGEDHRREGQRSLEASKVTQPEAAAKSLKKPREDHVQSPSNTMKTDSTGQKRRYCGLENQGSCCLNAVLQTLFMTKEFREHVESVSSDDDFIKELKKLFNELETQKNAVSAAGIVKSLGITDVHKEQDAAELLHLILDQTPGSSEIFKGTIKTTITWRSCGHKQESLEAFLSLTVSFEDSQDVEDAVEAHIDQMCGEYPLNCFHCNSTGCKKESEMINFPKLLIIQLSRFEKVSYGYRKNVWKVIIRPQIKVSSQTYELYAIVNHCGTYDGGYYNADIKCEDKIWYRFNDCSVSESPLKSVFINESSTLRSSFAYLLVYRRRE